MKENDNGKLNSFMKNLPKNTTLYWFVAHCDNKPMSISIVSLKNDLFNFIACLCSKM